MNRILLEGLDYEDMQGQIEPKLTIDEYVAKMGKDSDIVTLSFTVSGKMAGEDLVSWFERGYDFVLDASVSDGEIEPGKYLVFVEMNRRLAVPSRIIELLEDLQTLTTFKLKDWTVEVEEEEYDAEEEILKQVLILNPNEYKMKKEKEGELNEMRTLANLEVSKLYSDDKELSELQHLARI